jgi:hypothetical protein
MPLLAFSLDFVFVCDHLVPQERRPKATATIEQPPTEQPPGRFANSPSAAATTFGPGRRGPPKRNEHPGSGNKNTTVAHWHRITLDLQVSSYVYPVAVVLHLQGLDAWYTTTMADW